MPSYFPRIYLKNPQLQPGQLREQVSWGRHYTSWVPTPIVQHHDIKLRVAIRKRLETVLIEIKTS
jgi:hypothetical protein